LPARGAFKAQPNIEQKTSFEPGFIAISGGTHDLVSSTAFPRNSEEPQKRRRPLEMHNMRSQQICSNINAIYGGCCRLINIYHRTKTWESGRGEKIFGD